MPEYHMIFFGKRPPCGGAICFYSRSSDSLFISRHGFLWVLFSRVFCSCTLCTRFKSGVCSRFVSRGLNSWCCFWIHLRICYTLTPFFVIQYSRSEIEICFICNCYTFCVTNICNRLAACFADCAVRYCGCTPNRQQFVFRSRYYHKNSYFRYVRNPEPTRFFPASLRVLIRFLRYWRTCKRLRTNRVRIRTDRPDRSVKSGQIFKNLKNCKRNIFYSVMHWWRFRLIWSQSESLHF